jgi:hypothetical protein
VNLVGDRLQFSSEIQLLGENILRYRLCLKYCTHGLNLIFSRRFARLKDKNLVVLLQDFQRRVHGDRFVAHPSRGIHQKGYMADMVKMRMRNEYMIDPRELLKAESAHPFAGVNQNIIIQ